MTFLTVIIIGWILNGLIWNYFDNSGEITELGNPILWILVIPYIIFPIVLLVLITERSDKL